MLKLRTPSEAKANVPSAPIYLREVALILAGMGIDGAEHRACPICGFLREFIEEDEDGRHFISASNVTNDCALKHLRELGVVI